MTLNLTITLILQLILTGPVLTESDKCEWFKELEISVNVEEKLELIKNNYWDYESSWPSKPDETKCKIVYILYLKEKQLIITDHYVTDPERIIQTIESKDLAYLRTIGENAADVLYKADNILIMFSESEELEERIWKIRLEKK
jgi:hypothetical protein